MNIINNNDEFNESNDFNDFNEFLRISQHIKQNLEQIMKNPNIKNIIDNSENIINKYSEIWSDLDYHEVISCYIALLCLYYKLF
jgi:hypothetical protein